MIPQTLVAMLACARIGAIHSVVFGGFAANELAVRIDDAQPKAIVAASCGIEQGGLSLTNHSLTGPLIWPRINRARHHLSTRTTHCRFILRAGSRLAESA